MSCENEIDCCLPQMFDYNSNTPDPAPEPEPSTECPTCTEDAIGTCSPAQCDGLDTNQYQIADYTDGDIPNPSGPPAPGSVVWDGSFRYKALTNSCAWGATYLGGDTLQMDGAEMCNARLISGLGWVLTIWSNGTVLWSGENLAGTSPAGIYSRTSGAIATPPTIQIMSIGGTATEQNLNFLSCV